MADIWKIAVEARYERGPNGVAKYTTYAFCDRDGELKTSIDWAAFPDITTAKARDPAYDGIGLHINLGYKRGGYRLHPLDQFALDERRRRTTRRAAQCRSV